MRENSSHVPCVSAARRRRVRVVSQISTRLAKRGHEVHVASYLPAGAPRSEVLNGVNVHRFDVRGDALRGLNGEVDD